MELILIEDVDHLGKAGEVVKVKTGFGRNYLLPQKKAILADRGNIKSFEQRRKMVERQNELRRQHYQELAAKINGAEITIQKKVGAEDKIFGSVTNHEIAEALASKGFSLDKKHILIKDPIKTIGTFEIEVKLAQDISAPIKVWVIRQE